MEIFAGSISPGKCFVIESYQTAHLEVVAGLRLYRHSHLGLILAKRVRLSPHLMSM